MKEDISKIAVIGCSDEGYDVAKEIVGKLSIGPKGTVILVPHICAKSMYDYLLDKRKDKRVYPILDNQVIEPQSIYVGMENPTKLSSDNYYGLRRKLMIKKEDGKYRFSLGESEIAYIDKAFCAVADAFKDKSIGVILYGMGGAGLYGMTRIKEVGGVTLVQTIDEEKDYVQWSMPYLVIKHGEADHILPIDKIGSKLEDYVQWSMPYLVIKQGEADHILPIDKIGSKLEELLRL